MDLHELELTIEFCKGWDSKVSRKHPSQATIRRMLKGCVSKDTARALGEKYAGCVLHVEEAFKDSAKNTEWARKLAIDSMMNSSN